MNMLVAIKPTVGRISRHGVIPLTADQDTAGPMARTVADAAILFGALEGARARSGRSAQALCTRRRTAITRDILIATRLRARASASRAPSIMSASRCPA